MSESIHELTARDIMTRRADTIRRDKTVQTAIEKMVNLDLSALPVVDDQGECVGLLTKTDIIRLTGFLNNESHGARPDLAALFFGVGLEEITSARIEDIMTEHVFSVRPDDSIGAVADQMLRHEIHHIPVCDTRNHLIGVISSMDIVKVIRRPLPSNPPGQN